MDSMDDERPPPSPPMMKSRSANMGRSGGGGGGTYGGGSGSGTLGQDVLSQADVNGNEFDPKSVETMLVRQGNIQMMSDADKLESIAEEATALVSKAGGFVSARNTYRQRIGWGKHK